jgi:hypothetical protein
MTVNANLTIALAASLVGAQQFGGPYWTGDMATSFAFADGVGANQADKLYLAERTVLTGANDDIDLNAVLLDGLGVAIAATELVGIFIMNRRRAEGSAANTTSLTLGGAANPVPGYAAAGLVIKPGGVFVHVNPDATGIATITAATGDILRVTNAAGATVIYTIGLILRSA